MTSTCNRLPLKRCRNDDCCGNPEISRYLVVRFDLAAWPLVVWGGGVVALVGIALALPFKLVVGCILLGAIPFGGAILVRRSCERCRAVIDERTVARS